MRREPTKDRIIAMTARVRRESSAAWKKLMRKHSGVPRPGMRETPGMRERAWHCDHSRAALTSERAKRARAVTMARMMGTIIRERIRAVWMRGLAMT